MYSKNKQANKIWLQNSIFMSVISCIINAYPYYLLSRAVDYYVSHYFEHLFERIIGVRKYLYKAVKCRLYSRIYERLDIFVSKDYLGKGLSEIMKVISKNTN